MSKEGDTEWTTTDDVESKQVTSPDTKTIISNNENTEWTATYDVESKQVSSSKVGVTAPKTQPQASPTSSPDTKPMITIGEYHIAVPGAKVPLVGVMSAAIIVIVTLILENVIDTSYVTYGYVVAVTAFVVAFASLIMPNAWTFVIYTLNYFLFFWTFVAACVLTFKDGPFASGGNGYWGSWGLVVFSAMSTEPTDPPSGSLEENLMDKSNDNLALGAVSIVVMLALIFAFEDESNPDPNFSEKYQGELIYGLIVACTSVALVVLFTFLTCCKSGELACSEGYVLTVLAVCWIVAAGVLTFGPFSVSFNNNNGYFASWLAAVISVKAASHSLKHRNQ